MQIRPGGFARLFFRAAPISGVIDMSALQALHNLVGNFSATSKLWIYSTEEPRSCHSDAVVTPVAQGKFLRLDYTWQFDGTPQSGSILIGHESDRNTVTAVWIDSWHMGEKYMACEGKFIAGGSDNSAIELRGSY